MDAKVKVKVKSDALRDTQTSDNKMIYCFTHKLTIVTSSILEMLRTRVFTLTIVGPSLPVICETVSIKIKGEE